MPSVSMTIWREIKMETNTDSAKELTMRWLKFYTYVVLPFKIITSPVTIQMII